MAPKVKCILITICLFIFLNIQLVYAAEKNSDEYKVSFKYYPQYSVQGSSKYTGLGYHTINDMSYTDDWELKHTYTIETSPVAIYSVVDKFNDFTFSIQGIVEGSNPGKVQNFKLINMNVYYDFYPDHILTEAKLQGTLCTYIDDLYFQANCTKAYLQGKNRTTGEWTVLKTFDLHSNEIVNWTWEGTDSKPSFNYSAYRINFSLWNWNFDGLTLIASGSSNGVNKLVSCDYVGVETNEWEKKVEELVDLQSKTILEIKSLGDLIKAIPDLILDGLYKLIVPDDLAGKFSNYIDQLLDRLGILGFPFQVIKYELQQITNYNPNPKFSIPDIEFMGQTFLKDYEFDFNTVGQINVAILNLKLINIVRMITAYLFAFAVIGRVKVLLYDFGILKSHDDDLGGGV